MITIDLSKIVFIFVILVASLTTEAKINFPKPSKNQCVFYTELESELRCNKDIPNYLSGYGLKYCNEFQFRKKEWNNRLQSWVEETTFCLQKTLTYDESLLLPCDKIQEYAFDSHPRCYKSSGFCGLDDDYKKTILKVVSIADIKSTVGSSTLQGLSVAIKCDIGVSQSVVFVVSFMWNIVKDAVLENMEKYRREALALIEFIFSDYNKIELNALAVMADMLGIQTESLSKATSNTDIHATASLNGLSQWCKNDLSINGQLCGEMSSKYGKNWQQLTIEKKVDLAGEGLERAYLKYGLGLKK